MKSLMKIATILFVLFTLNSASAGDVNGTNYPFFKIKNAGEKTFYFETSEMSSSYVEVIFKDEKGNILFSEYAIHPATFERKYNLNELENGAYFIVVKSDTNTQILPITISKDSLEMDWNHLETM